MKPKTLNRLYPLEDVFEFIKEGRVLVIAGSENLLRNLPKGNWIGGTIPYFMDTKGGTFSKNKLFVTDFSGILKSFKIEKYQTDDLEKIVSNGYSNGFTYMLIPAFSDMHQKYAIEAESIPGLYNIPIVGWITGIDLNETGKSTPKVVNGWNNEFLGSAAIALHVELPESNIAQLEILNIFKQGNNGSIVFDEEGFYSKTCQIDGQSVNFSEYIKTHNIDTRLPLVANYSGATINISFQHIDENEKKVMFYAPVRKNAEYRIADTFNDYITEFNKILPSNENENIVASCNCILNYLYSELENKNTPGITGPITFGEIAYVLVNQTLVYLKIK